MIVVSKYIVPKGYLGISLYPFVVLKYRTLKQNQVLVNHEKIHLRQQLELLILPFYLIYAFEFLIRFMKYKEWSLAYKNISFEREAFRNEDNLGYLKQRQLWSFMKYF